MKIPNALEEMVAGLISDEKEKREEIEDLLGKIHEITEAFYHPRPDQEMAARIAERNGLINPAPEEPPAPVLSQAEKLKNFTGMFERKGLPPDLAADKAEEMLGMRDGSR